MLFQHTIKATEVITLLYIYIYYDFFFNFCFFYFFNLHLSKNLTHGHEAPQHTQTQGESGHVSSISMIIHQLSGFFLLSLILVLEGKQQHVNENYTWVAHKTTQVFSEAHHQLLKQITKGWFSI